MIVIGVGVVVVYCDDCVIWVEWWYDATVDEQTDVGGVGLKKYDGRVGVDVEGLIYMYESSWLTSVLRMRGR